ncbi:MAG: hypothetical protein H8E34_04995 [Bacteroidetes bacterium]|nr:hypothetical protein [Bacteroidota bacterium]MBL6944454.1 hypothetical protein [Bacteroidales bacterium]
MNKILILGFILLLGLNTLAEGGKSFLMLRSGLSLPLGKYSENNLIGGSFTTPGVSFGGEGAWFFKDYLGVGLDVNYILHPVDAAALATEKVRVDPFLLDMNVRSEPYSFLALMAGFYSSVELSKRISLQPKILGGIMFGKTPFQLYEQTYLFPGPNYFKVTSSSDKGFGFKGGFSIKYNLNNCVALGFNADYTYSGLSFGFMTATGHEYRKKNISFIDIGLGLVIKL